MKKTFSLTIMIFGFLSCVAQNGIINGKIIAKIPEEKHLISEKVKVILNIGNEKKIASIDENLNFTFQNLKSDSIRITTKPKSYGRNQIIIGFLKPNDTVNLKISYSFTCKYDKSENNKTCPVCNKKDKVIPIIYGLVIETKENEGEYKLGGCVITDCDPNWFCEKDQIEF